MRAASSALVTTGLVAGLLSPACIRQSVPESTTTVIGGGGGVALSVDGRFSLLIPPGALARDVEIVIETERMAADAQVAPTYRVGPSDLELLAPATASLQAPATWIGELALASPEHGPLAGAVLVPEEGGGGRFQVQLRRLDCAGRACSAQDACPDGATCSSQGCMYACTSDFECASPQPTYCDRFSSCTLRGGTRCTAEHTCTGDPFPGDPAALASIVAPTAPALTCAGNGFTLLLSTRADPCASRGCGESCRACDGSSPACHSGAGACDASGACVAESEVSCPLPSAVPAPDGWDAIPGTGHAFVLSGVAIADAQHGFDLGGTCTGVSCADNRLADLGPLVNDQLRQGLLGGETLILVEVAGIEGSTTDDPSVTIKLYGGRDADDPFFPANNFRVPEGESTCCEFRVNPHSLDANGQARARVRGQLRNGVLSSVGPFDIDLALTFGVPPHPVLRLSRARLMARVPSHMGELQDGVLGAVMSIGALAELDNPYCKTINNRCPSQNPESSMLDFIAGNFQPDIDLDVPADGLERVEVVDGMVSQCIDGCGPGSCAVVPPIDPASPASCALDPRMADGYSIAFTLSGPAARIR